MTNATGAPALRWQVLVDWTDNGIWGAANVDGSGDVVGLRWQAGRRGRPVPEFAPPATLELSLRNSDGRYTPGNAASPLAGMVNPGRAVWLRAAWLYDDFTDAAADGDGDAGAGATASSLDGRIADGVGGRWQVSAAAGSGFTVQRGEVRGARGSGRISESTATLDAGDPLATLVVRYRRSSNGRAGLALRCAAADNCLRLRFGSAATILERVSGRRVSQLVADGAALTANQWHELEITQTATTVQVFATNLEASGTVRQELLTAESIADAPNSGRHGLWNGFRNRADRWGDFSAGRSLFVGRISAIEPEHRPGICRIAAVDIMGRLDGIRLFRQLSAGRMNMGAVAASILRWAGLEAADYQADAGRLLRSGGPRAVWDVTAGQALRRLQREENGLLYADGLGRVRLESAAQRAAVRSNPAPTALAKIAVVDTSVADIAGDAVSSLSASPYAAGREWNDNSGAVESPLTFRYRRATDHGRQRIWSLNEPLDLPPGGSRTLAAVANEWDAITDVAAPVANTDYRATVDAAGTGTDATASVQVSLLPESESEIAGRGVALRVSNRGAQTAYVQRLRLYAAHCWRADGSTSYTKSAAAGPDTAASGGPPTARTVDCRYADHYAAAQGGADARFAERGRRRAQMELTLPLAAIANRRASVEGQISDVITAAAPAGGNPTAWFLEGIELTAGAGAASRARWWLTAV